MNENLEIILASSSPYRKELMDQLGIKYKIIKPNFEENILENETPNELVNRLSKGKAMSVVEMGNEGLIIGSDQIYVFNGRIGGKNKTKEEAKNKLMQMRGQRQEFITGLFVYNTHTKTEYILHESVYVKLFDFSEDEIDKYLELNEAMDCAGSIKIEGKGLIFVEEMLGDYHTLRGLPMYKLIKILRKEGVNFFN